ncbi:MAG TPA: DUF998 domain-containing protein [Candidatus Saccharimonadales bacterium]|nr:DUF998 domain-containing protein [Candidatus Saccharimonadales bacterium]
MQAVLKPAEGSQVFYVLLGSIFWISSVQYFVIQLLVALAWQKTYSVLHNTISDLGNTVCGPYHGGFVCSPLHGWMNASFVALGLSMSLGSVLLYRQYSKNAMGVAAFGCMCLAGLGTMLVGLFPENTIGTLHVIGAALPFIIGNLALVLFGSALDIPRTLRYYTIISGFVALSALVLFITHTYLGLGAGGMERITAYPQTIWLIVFGSYSLHSYYKKSTYQKSKVV